ncbi:hypothetical protein LOK49_LG12G01921 [Camellia lanceoleosa]|uniref:Uncharacterized protein n=1 Tax=Camellia lanceoleosa TaxID=1840588 RepID=A0ACC0FTP1_9ERIC|nr:hypothetical protein LOK49_LG12G01921 [Camellia lanceoleosa]
MEFIPDTIPVLITVLKDGTPAVTRQAITCGIDLFGSTLVKVAIQGLYSSELDNSLKSSWAWVLKFRDEIYLIAFQTAVTPPPPKTDGPSGKITDEFTSVGSIGKVRQVIRAVVDMRFGEGLLLILTALEVLDNLI